MNLLSLRTGKSTSNVSQLANRSRTSLKIEPDEEARTGTDTQATAAIFDEWAFGAEI